MEQLTADVLERHQQQIDADRQSREGSNNQQQERIVVEQRGAQTSNSLEPTFLNRNTFAAGNCN